MQLQVPPRAAPVLQVNIRARSDRVRVRRAAQVSLGERRAAMRPPRDAAGGPGSGRDLHSSELTAIYHRSLMSFRCPRVCVGAHIERSDRCVPLLLAGVQVDSPRRARAPALPAPRADLPPVTVRGCASSARRASIRVHRGRPLVRCAAQVSPTRTASQPPLLHIRIVVADSRF